MFNINADEERSQKVFVECSKLDGSCMGSSNADKIFKFSNGNVKKKSEGPG